MIYRKAGDFEDPIIEIRKEIEKAVNFGGPDAKSQIEGLRIQLNDTTQDIYGNLTPWQKVQVARHPDRPYTSDYLHYLCDDFVEIHGDRHFADDAAIVGGFATFRGRKVCFIGHQKGRTTAEKVRRNFGMARPEGYRKALRLMKLAEKFNRPVLTLIDTAGAFPGIDAEERGQAEAIALNLREMAALRVPLIATITGEGGSGGALGLAVADVVNILQFAVYSVISPEGCAAILWKDVSDDSKEKAAANLGLTPDVLMKYRLVDRIIPETAGGAHIDHEGMARILGDLYEEDLNRLGPMDPEQRIDERFEKFRRMGEFTEIAEPPRNNS